MRPRILIVTLQMAAGGTERHISEVAPRLVRRGFDVTVLELLGRGELSGPLEAAGVRVLGPPRFGPALVMGPARLLGAMLADRPTVAHFFLPLAYLAGAPLALLARVPVLIMSRRSQNDYQRKRPRIARIEHALHARMDAVLANSRRVARDLEEEGVPRDKLHLIYNGVDLERFDRRSDREATRARLGVPADALVLVIVANLIPYKGHADLISALTLVQQRLPRPWRLLVAGRDDGIGSELARQAERAGLGGNILWLGGRADVPDLLGAADIGLLVSHEEGFANAVIEGMAAGLPMIVTDVGGNAEAIGGGEAGIVVPARQPVALAMAIDALANDRQRARGLGEAARLRVESTYSLEVCVGHYERLYMGLIDKSAGAEGAKSLAGRA